MILFLTTLIGLQLSAVSAALAQNTTAPLQLHNRPQPVPGPAISEQLADIKGPIVLQESNNMHLLIAALILGLILGGLAWFLWRKRDKQQKTIAPHTLALSQLAKAEKLIEQQQPDRFVDLVGTILRSYIEQRFSISARNRTTREFIEKITSSQGNAPRELEENSQYLQTWMAQMDMCKFARAELTTLDMEQILENLRSFIRSTGQEETT